MCPVSVLRERAVHPASVARAPSARHAPREQAVHPISVPRTPRACCAQSPVSGTASRGADGAVPQGEQFVYREDWGEALSTRSVPVLCALDLEGSSLSVLEGVPEHLSPGQVRMGCRGGAPRGPAWGCGMSPTVAQALWSPDDRGVVFVGWWHEPFRLGLSACSNRRWVPAGTQRRARMPTPCQRGSAQLQGSKPDPCLLPRSGIFYLDLASGRCGEHREGRGVP